MFNDGNGHIFVNRYEEEDLASQLDDEDWEWVGSDFQDNLKLLSDEEKFSVLEELHPHNIIPDKR